MTNVSLSGLSLGGIPEGYSKSTPGGIRGKQGSNDEKLDTSLGCHQVYPQCISIYPTLVAEPGGTSMVAGKESFGEKSVYTPI